MDSRGIAHDDVALARVQRIAQEAAALREPRIGQIRTDFIREERGDPIFKPAPIAFGERKVVRVGADAQLARLQRRASDYREQPDDRLTEAQRHTACLPWSCTSAGRSLR